jgi:bacillithiol biosynthesis deacetylase BshB1
MVDVLAFAAHPDDVELGCAGTALRLTDAGHSLAIVDLTRGERGSRGTAQTRAEEAVRASALLGLAERETLEFPDTELRPTLELRKAVVGAIRRHRPRIVLAPAPQDLHPDHAAAGTAVREAYYPSGMKHFDAPGEPHRPAHVFHYFMHDEQPTPLVVDVTPVWERRMEVARCYASQLDGAEGAAGAFPTLISRPDFLDRIEARARVWGRRAGVTFGEPLLVQDALAICDPAMLFARPAGSN